MPGSRRYSLSLKQRTTVGATVEQYGGRYLVLHLPEKRQLAVFDVNRAAVVRHIPVADDDVVFAAGLDRLLRRS